MKINRNMSAVIANNQLMRTEDKLKASIERLSSGLKLNSAKDNPAGMAISNKMKAQIDALGQANRNSNDGISVVQIADGALNEVASVLQRIRELSVQAANDTNTYEDRQSIQQEVAQLVKEVDRVSTDTEFNTKTLLDGSSDTRIYSDHASRVNISDAVPPRKYQIDSAAVATKAGASISVPETIPADGSISVNGIGVEVKVGMSKEEFMYELDKAATQAGTTLDSTVAPDEVFIESKIPGSQGEVSVTISANLMGAFNLSNAVLDTETNTYKSQNNGEDCAVKLGDGFSDNAVISTSGNRVYIRDSAGFQMDFLMDNTLDGATPIEIDVTDIGRMTVQIGANQYQDMDIRIPEISTKSLYLDTIDTTVVGGAERAITTVDEAIAKMSSVRSSIGAFQNRLEYASASLAETEENMTAAFSQITDTDMATEMAEYAQQNILDQAAVSVLSQANDLPQQVLSLLSR